MDHSDPRATAIGTLLGFVLLVWVVWSDINYLQEGRNQLKEEALAAHRPSRQSWKQVAKATLRRLPKSP